LPLPSICKHRLTNIKPPKTYHVLFIFGLSGQITKTKPKGLIIVIWTLILEHLSQQKLISYQI